jgi:transcriptional regulator with XRE-family HTH domain
VTSDAMNTDANAEELYRQAAGAVLRRLRDEQGWSLRQFAEHVGVAHTSLHAVERGETTPTMDTLARVAASRGLGFPAILALILDEIIARELPGQSPLSALMETAASLSNAQLQELIGFVDYLKFRDRVSEPESR